MNETYDWWDSINFTKIKNYLRSDCRNIYNNINWNQTCQITTSLAILESPQLSSSPTSEPPTAVPKLELASVPWVSSNPSLSWSRLSPLLWLVSSVSMVWLLLLSSFKKVNPFLYSSWKWLHRKLCIRPSGFRTLLWVQFTGSRTGNWNCWRCRSASKRAAGQNIRGNDSDIDFRRSAGVVWADRIVDSHVTVRGNDL